MPRTPRRSDPVHEWLEGLDPKARPLVEAARVRILEVVPHAVERLRPGWGLIGYNAPAYFAFISVAREEVRIGFEWGVLLSDPEGVLEGEGAQVRSVRLRTREDVQAPRLAALLAEAASLRPPSGARRKGR